MSHLEQYVAYIREVARKVGQPSVAIRDFDDHYEPIGNVIRFDLRKDGLITERAGQIYLTAKAMQNR